MINAAVTERNWPPIYTDYGREVMLRAFRPEASRVYQEGCPAVHARSFATEVAQDDFHIRVCCFTGVPAVDHQLSTVD